MGNLWADCPTPLECRGSISIPTAPTKMINRFDWRRNILFGASRNWANNLQRRKVPTTSWLCAKRSVVQMSSSNDLHFPLQIGVKWRDAATTFSSFCSPRSPNRTSFGMGRLKPRPTFSPHSSRYWTSSRRTPSESSCCRSHGPSSVAKRQCSIWKVSPLQKYNTYPKGQLTRPERPE